MHLSRLLSLATLLVPVALAAPARAEAPVDTQDGSEIVVTATRLDAARDSIQPALGASEYTLDRAALDIQPGGADRAIKNVLLQAPGVTQDADNDAHGIHIRNEHGNVQYRLDGVTLPDSFADFGTPVDQRIAGSIALITGTLPAQYGLRTAGVVDIKTTPGKFVFAGDVSLYGGGNSLIEPSGSVRGATGGVNYFLSGSYLSSELGIANPIPSREAIHDHTEQERAFGYVSYILADSSRLTAFGAVSFATFQIPNVPEQTPQFVLDGRTGFDSALLDQIQRNRNHFAALAYQYSGGGIDLQVAPFVRYAQLEVTPDPQGGLLMFNGADSNFAEESLSWGVQADASARLGAAHTLRFGAYFNRDRTTSDSLVRAFPADSEGVQASDVPLNIPVAQDIAGTIWSAYIQDEWLLGHGLTLNYGLRYDHFSGPTTEGQVSPRISLVWKATPSTTFHAGYARYFTPPSLQLVAASELERFAGTTAAAPTLMADPVRAERQHSFGLGIEQRLGAFALGLDAYLKLARNLLDEESLGATSVEAPFNYAKARTWGVELTANYAHGPIEAYLNVARGQQKASRIVSNQFFFDTGELAYLADHWIYTDHTQKWTVSGGASFKLHDSLGALIPSFDFVYGSGLRKDDPAGLVPNGGTVDPYVQVNLGIAQLLGADPAHAFTLRVDVTNLFDATYLIRDGSGVGSGAPQYGPRRAVFVGLSRTF
jgi:outer membrane receptor protein involved in Fe transport